MIDPELAIQVVLESRIIAYDTETSGLDPTTNFICGYVITDNSRIRRLYYVQPLAHVEGMLMAYLPAERIAFQADLFDTHEPPRAAQLPAMRSLLNQVQRMKLDVATLAPVHGTPVPWNTFVAAVKSVAGSK